MTNENERILTDAEMHFINALPDAVHIKGIWSNQVYVNHELLLPDPRQEKADFPCGRIGVFSWGFYGDQVAALGLAILLRYVDWDTAQPYYMDFAFNWLAHLPTADFEGVYDLKAINGKWLALRAVAKSIFPELDNFITDIVNHRSHE